MRKLDPQEREIIRELIRNPRISDNKLSLKTGIPAMTVNRKRKKLENEELLHYYSVFDSSKSRLFSIRKLYIIKFKIGITARRYLDAIENDKQFQEFNQEHIQTSYLSEKDGHFALALVVDSESDATLLENFNGFIVPHLKQLFGEDAIVSIDTTKLHKIVRQHHNYLPGVNMKHGVIKEDWPAERVFVDELHEW